MFLVLSFNLPHSGFPTKRHSNPHFGCLAPTDKQHTLLWMNEWMNNGQWMQHTSQCSFQYNNRNVIFPHEVRLTLPTLQSGFLLLFYKLILWSKEVIFQNTGGDYHMNNFTYYQQSHKLKRIYYPLKHHMWKWSHIWM